MKSTPEQDYSNRFKELIDLSYSELADIVIKNMPYSKKDLVEMIIGSDWDIDDGSPKEPIDLSLFGKVNLDGLLNSIQEICKDYKFKQIGNKISYKKG